MPVFSSGVKQGEKEKEGTAVEEEEGTAVEEAVAVEEPIGRGSLFKRQCLQLASYRGSCC